MKNDYFTNGFENICSSVTFKETQHSTHGLLERRFVYFHKISREMFHRSFSTYQGRLCFRIKRPSPNKAPLRITIHLILRLEWNWTRFILRLHNTSLMSTAWFSCFSRVHIGSVLCSRRRRNEAPAIGYSMFTGEWCTFEIRLHIASMGLGFCNNNDDKKTLFSQTFVFNLKHNAMQWKY